MLMKEAVIVSATMVETKLNPGESKGFVEEMRFVAIAIYKNIYRFLGKNGGGRRRVGILVVLSSWLR
jgi:hypothetical protein